MNRYIVAPSARDDLDGIWDHIGHIAHGAMDQEALFRKWLASGDLP